MVRPHSAADVYAADQPPPKTHRPNRTRNHGADIPGEPRHQRRCDTQKKKAPGSGAWRASGLGTNHRRYPHCEYHP